MYQFKRVNSPSIPCQNKYLKKEDLEKLKLSWYSKDPVLLDGRQDTRPPSRPPTASYCFCNRPQMVSFFLVSVARKNKKKIDKEDCITLVATFLFDSLLQQHCRQVGRPRNASRVNKNNIYILYMMRLLL